MTLKQLRYLREVVKRGLHISQAAAALHTSQPGISRQIQLLERELGVTILERRRNKVLGLTRPGRDIVQFAERMLREEQNILSLGEELRGEVSGNLLIATNHTHARYTLPPVLTKFKKAYPSVRLQFWQGNREESFRWLDAGDVDMAIGTDCDPSLDNVVLLPFGRFHRLLITPLEHPLLHATRPSLVEIAKFPIITHGFRGKDHWKLASAFSEERLNLDIPFAAVDVDVSKLYVELGLGIAILPHFVYQPQRDTRLAAIDVSYLFEPEIMHIGINKNVFHRRFVFDFIEMLGPALTPRRVKRALAD
jgi:LysR family transcriptional regulator, cys regulon transcriptional activator